MPATRSQLIAMAQGVAARYGIDPDIGIRQLAQESGNFSPAVVYGPRKSSAGAAGIAQFMPATAARFGLGNPYDPVAALEAWGKYMSHLLSIFGGRYDLALAGYNWGEGSRARGNRPALWSALDSGKSALAYSLPAETRQYISIILGGSSPGAPADSGGGVVGAGSGAGELEAVDGANESGGASLLAGGSILGTLGLVGGLWWLVDWLTDD